MAHGSENVQDVSFELNRRLLEVPMERWPAIWWSLIHDAEWPKDLGEPIQCPSIKLASSARSSLKELYQSGDLTGNAAAQAMVDFCGDTEEEAQQKVAEWEFESEYGFAYDVKTQRFKTGALSGDELHEILMNTGGKTADEASASIVSYSRDAYEEGYFSRKQTAEMMTKYGGLTAGEAEEKLRYIDFKLDNPGVYVDDAWVDEYYNEVESSGISIDVFVDYRNKVKDITGSGKKEGRMAVIDSMPISDAQKDALYYAEGWSASKLWQAPWH